MSEQQTVENNNEPKEYPYSLDIIRILLKDRTTKRNIKWATSDYETLAHKKPHDVIKSRDVYFIKPHSSKSKANKRQRTQDRAEVFTAAWICNLQNNLIDEEWFGRPNVFNKPRANAKNPEQEYEPTQRITFGSRSSRGKTWQDYVLAKRLEITCGEAPYLVSRYDSTNGQPIPIDHRIGLLDRKLRVISQKIQKKALWYTWAKKAFQTIYGYEYQGDSLFLARKNLLDTFCDYYIQQFKRSPSEEQLFEIATIISWNIWQMDGLKYTVPFSASEGPDLYAIICEWLDDSTRLEFEYRQLIPGEFFKTIKEYITKKHGKDMYLPSLMLDAKHLYEKARKNQAKSEEPQLSLFSFKASNTSEKKYVITLASVNSGRLSFEKTHLSSQKPLENHLFLGAFASEQEANNFVSYLNTNFVHYLISTQASLEAESPQYEKYFKLVPIQNFQEPWDDQKLSELYGLSVKEQQLLTQFIGQALA